MLWVCAYGEPKHKTMLKRKLDSENLHWGLNIKFDGKPEDLAASVQSVYEDELLKLVEKCSREKFSYHGCSALNCVANSKIKGKNIWIMPSPGDAGSSLGASCSCSRENLNGNHHI